MRRRPRLAQPQSAREAQPVTVVRAHPLAWATARELAGGDVHRLLIVDSSTVIVRNHHRKPGRGRA